MTQEEKAKAYDKVSKEVKDFFEGKQKMYSDVTQTLEYLFPELKESENEKIIRSLKEIVIDAFSVGQKGVLVSINELKKDDLIAWLEKQEKKEIDVEQLSAWSEVDENFFADVCSIIDIDRIFMESAKRRYKNWLKSLKERVQPQPKQEWSDEDNENMNSLCVLLDQMVSFNAIGNEHSIEYKHWLKTLEERVQPQPKQEWSEEDEQYLLVCKNALSKYQTTDKWDACIISQWLENKLKSLRPQNRWKPSDEQMEVLFKYAEQNNYDGSVLTALYQDLKKLREE